jgi:hypothetical protein
MEFQFGKDVRRYRHRPPAGLGLRRSEPHGAVTQLLRLFGDGEPAVEQIDVTPSERQELAEAQPAERAGQDERPELGSDGVSQGVDLRDGQGRTFGRAFGARALDRARVLGDRLVLDGGVEDGPKQSVALLRRRDTRLRSGQHLGPPGPDDVRRHRPDLELAERREDVETQEALVELPRPWPQIRPSGEPLTAVLLQGDLAPSRVDPRAPSSVGQLGRSETLRLPLRPERSPVQAAVRIPEPNVVHRLAALEHPSFDTHPFAALGSPPFDDGRRGRLRMNASRLETVTRAARPMWTTSNLPAPMSS